MPVCALRAPSSLVTGHEAQNLRNVGGVGGDVYNLGGRHSRSVSAHITYLI